MKRINFYKFLRISIISLVIFSWLFTDLSVFFGLPSQVKQAHAAFPQVAATATSSRFSNLVDDTVTLPTGVASGDLVLVFHASDGALTRTFPGSWVEIKDATVSGGTANIGVAYLIASGGETSVVVTKSVTERFTAIAIRISAASWHGTTPPEISTGATGDSQNPDPDSVTASWGSADNLFIAIAAIDANASMPMTAFPTNYADNQINGNSTDVSAGYEAIASRNLAAASDDPGTFTATATEQWWAGTVVVRPSLAVPTTNRTKPHLVRGKVRIRGHVKFR